MFTLKNNEDDCEDKALFVNPSQDSSQSQDTSPGQETQLNTIKTLIKQIEEQLSHPKVRGIRLPNIIQSLQTIKAGNEACINLADDLGGLKETEKISGNANNILQPRFHGTNKKKGRPKKVPLRKPSKEEKEQLLKDQNLPEVIPERRDMQNAPTVAPYPPLRLVPSSSSTDPLSREPEQSLFEVDGRIGLQSWMRVPPPLIGRRITITTKDGKKQVLMFSNGVADDNSNKNDPPA
nr:uncharacterized protein LOC117690445 [Crassostrea gigas]XP_034331595.1 uncharacterized protein LOC117690879 [Crassostrea gigas]